MLFFQNLLLVGSAIASIASAQRGNILKLNGTDTYVVGPRGFPGKFNAPHRDLKAILFVTDVFGYATANAQGVADTIANAGYLVVMPDLFDGDAWDNSRDFTQIAAWAANFGTNVTDPKLDGVLDAAKAKYKPKAVGTIGYCFGGKYVFRLLSAGKVSTGVAVHPSFATIEEVSGATAPVQIVSAAVDPSFDINFRRQIEDSLQALGKQYQMNVFSGVAHGYGVNANVSIPVQRYAKEQTTAGAIAWFNAWL